MPQSTLVNVLTERERRAPPEQYESEYWYACYTRARAEKKAAEGLGRRGFESYTPTAPVERQWADRTTVVDWPIFPSYTFARFSLSDMHRILVTPGISTIVRNEGYPTPVPEEDMQNVRRFAEALAETGAAEFEPEVLPLPAEGTRVRITDGPFQGINAVVVERRSGYRVLVGLEAVGRGMPVDVDGRYVKARIRG